MSLSSSSGSTWSEADPWSEQAKYLSSTAENGKTNALFNSAYSMWDNAKSDKKVSLGRPHVFGETDAVQTKAYGTADWNDDFIENARAGTIKDKYISTVADFMEPQTSAQNTILDMSRDMYGEYLGSNGSILSASKLGDLLPGAFGTAYDTMVGTNKISTPTANAATVGSYSNMSPAEVGTYNYPMAATVGQYNNMSPATVGAYYTGILPATVGSHSNMSPAGVAAITQGINRDVGNVAQQGGYNSTFGYDSPLSTIATGGYVGGNQYLDDMYSSARDKLYKEYNETLLPQWDTQAEAAGRDDSNVWAGGRADLQENYLDSLSNLSASLYGNAYEGDMNRMLQGLGLGSQQSQFEDTMTQDINRYNTDIQNRKQFEEAGYDYGADSLLANLQSSQFLQNAANQQEADRLASEQSLQKALTNAGYSQEVERLTSEQSLQEALTEAGYSQEAERLSSDQSLQKELANAGYTQEASARKADVVLQAVLAQAGYDQEASRLTAEQSMQKALTDAGFKQEATTATQRLVFDAELQNLANRMAMAQYAPDLAMRAYDPIQQEAGVGDIQQQQAQSEVDAAVRQGEFLESIPSNMLGTFANMISGNYGGTQMTESESGK